MREGKNETEDQDVTEGGAERAVARRNLLKFGGMAAAGAAGAALMSAVDASPADATTGNMQFGAANDAGSVETDLTSSSSANTLGVTNSHAGSSAAQGVAIQGHVSNASSHADALVAKNDGLGTALRASVTNASNTSDAVTIENAGTGTGLAVQCTNTGPTLPAIDASSSGSGAAIYGRSAVSQGVFGQTQDAGGIGVLGICLTPAAGTGVYAEADAGFGLIAVSVTGTALDASSSGVGAAAGIKNTGSGIALDVSDGVSGSGAALQAHVDNASSSADALVVANNGTGDGVKVTANGDGLSAQSTGGGNGVYALNGATTGLAGPAGVYGDSHSGTGVFGTTTTQIGVRGLHGGYSGQEALGGFGSGFAGGVVGEDNATGVGVIGASPSGIGVDGLSTAGTAVKATAGTGIGLLATANTATSVNPAVKAQSNGKGAAVLAATTANATVPAVQSTSGSAQPAVKAIGKAVVASTGVGAGNAAALNVQGVASFTRSSVVQVPINASTVLTPLVPGGLSATSHVLATIQSQYSQNIAIKSAVPILSGTNQGKIQINLTAANTTGVVINVAWFVFG